MLAPFCIDTHSLKRGGGGREGGRGAYNEKQYAFPLPGFYHSKNFQLFVQKDLAFDVNPMLFCLLLQALQCAIHFLSGKEMVYCLEGACEIHPTQGVTTAHKFLRKRQNVRGPHSYRCIAGRWSSCMTIKFISTAQKPDFSRGLPATHNQKQKQKDSISLAHLAPLYF